MKEFFKNVFASAFGVVIGLAIIFGIGTYVLIGLVAASAEESEYKPKSNTVFKLVLDGEIVDNSTSNPFLELMGEKEPLALSNILRSIRLAKENDNIKGIYIECGNTSSSPATLSAIRKALVDFKESGKFIISYSDSYSQGGYYVASVADSVFVNPLGGVELRGLASVGLFYTGLAEKIGVDFHVFKVGTFKGAVEPYFLKKFSDENREQISSYQASIWNNLTAEILASRPITKEELELYVNEGQFFEEGQATVDRKLTDGIRYRSEVENTVKVLAGQDVDDKLRAASVAKMVRIKDKTKVKDDKIAILYAEGQIMEESTGLSYSTQVISEKMCDELQKLAADEDVKAVVFRVNSPGGSAYISEQIWKKVIELKEKKPVVVSMGTYAASGGYYISCGANKIIAEPMTLTGSIGVFGLMANTTGLYDKVGLSADVVKTNPLADIGNTTRPMTEREKALIQASVERTYDLFISRCAEGRGMTKEQIDFIGQGRVWTGEQALERGLVDKLGGIDTAIEEAALLAELGEYSVITNNSKKDFFTEFLESKMEDVQMRMIKSALGDKFETFKTIYSATPQTGIQALLPVGIEGI